MAAPAQPMMPPPPPPQQTMGSPSVPEARPTGVTVLAVLNGIIGAFALLGGIGMMAGGGAMGSMMGGAEGGLFAAMAGVFGFVLLIMGVLYLLAAWGLWTRQRWAWYVAMVGVVLGILNGIVSLPFGIVGLLIAGLIGWYLLTPPVQRWFGLDYSVPWNKQAAT